ncbi:MAG: PKD domain-containing protein [Bacteroidota bacterium]
MQKKILTLLLFFPIFLFGQNTYNAPESGSLAISDCGGILYDSGGPNGNYTGDNSAVINISGTSGDYLELTFTEFDLESSFDNLFIIEGDSLSGNIIGFYSGNELPNNGQPIIVPGLEVVIAFQSDFMVNFSGFAMEFACKTNTEPPVANASFPSLSCTGNINFSDLSTGFANTWNWDFGDGNTSAEQNPTHTYAAAGVYSVELIACNANGCDTFAVNDAINYDPNSFLCTNGFVMPTFGSDTINACSGILFDSGGPGGDYTEGNYGGVLIDPPGGSSISVTFTEFDLGGTANNHDALYIYDPVTFTPLGTYFGQSLPSMGQTITFPASSIIVYFSSDHQNNFSGFAMTWETNGSASAPEAAFTASTTAIPFGGAVTFNDVSTNNPGIWSWDFGDGNTSSEQNPTHNYNSTGTFEVTFSATNCSGSDTTGNIFITVQEAPAISINPDSINVTIDAGTMGTQNVTICNNGTGDLTVDLSSIGQGGGSGITVGFLTNENGADFSWAVLDESFNVIQQSTQTYGPNQLYEETLYVSDFGTDIYFALYSPSGVQALQDVLWYDPVTGDLLFQLFLETGPNAVYIIPAHFFNFDPNATGIVDWLDVENIPTTIPPGACIDYEVTLDATNLNGGTYEGSIIVNSNDPNQSSSSIPVTLNVIGTPAIAVNPTTLDFGDVQIGAAPSLTFTIQNIGSDNLSVSGIVSSDPAFVLSGTDNYDLAPGTTQTIEVTFTPTATVAYASSFDIINNAGDNITVNLVGNGIPSPSLTIDPTAFTLELIQGQDSNLVVNIGNVGQADLDYSATSTTDGTGFDFTFTTDNWGGEFFWFLLDSQGSVVQASDNGGIFYDASTTYTEELTGLSPSESYTLQMFDAFGDGALSSFTITDRATGQVVQQGSFTDGFDFITDIGSPTEGNSIVSPNQGTVGVGGTQALSIAVSSVGLSTGTYNITVTVATNDPLQPTADVNITLFVIAPVVADFAAQQFVCGNLPVQFSDLTANVATSWDWDFGDGNTSTEQNPSHTYANSGTYTVSLTACNSLGCETITKTDYITVDTDCYAQNIPLNHGVETITVCEGNVYDSGGANGNYVEGSFGTLIIAPPGAQSVTISFSEFNYEEHGDFLYVYDGDQINGTFIGAYTGTQLSGQTLVATSGVLTLVEYTNHFVELSGFAASFTCSGDPIAPIANFNFLADTVLCTNQAVIFFDQSVGDVDQWFWDFGDGSISNQPNPAYQYAASGTYNVSLTVCNDVGCDTEIQSVDVQVDPNCTITQIPAGGFQIAPVFISSCGGILYDSGGENGNYLDDNFGIVTIYQPGIGITFSEFDYDFNDYVAVYDGLTTNAPLIGFYTGTELPNDGNTIFASGEGLTIVEYTDFQTNGSGFELTYACQTSGTALVSNNNNNILMFNTEICDGILRFATPDTMQVDTWTWSFGDNTTSSEASPTHEFPHNGTFEVSVEACYQGDCETYTTNIHSNKLTPAVMAPDEVVVGEEVQFEGMTDEATHWNWDFGNGEISDHNTPTTVYTEEGYHDVHIHLINMDVHETCDANHTHTILVKPDSSTNTEDLDAENIRVYPNPATEFIQIDFENNPTADFEVRIFSLNGQLIQLTQNQNTIDASDLSSGTYFLEVIQDEKAPQQFKIMIQR